MRITLFATNLPCMRPKSIIALMTFTFLLMMTSVPAKAATTTTTTIATTLQSPEACVPYSGSPVLPQSPFPGGNTTERASVMLNSSTYYMWYSVGVGEYWAIGFATSANGFNWTPHPSPVLQHGPNGTWDSGGVYSPTVVWNGSYYLMYFTGVANSVSSASIGVAFSKDMIHWQEYSENPILVPGPGAYDSYYIRSGTVLYSGDAYQMWYTGAPSGNSSFDVAIDYATSADGLHWTKYAENPVMVDIGGAGSPAVVKVGETYVMAFNWYYITYATSSDGVHWSWDNLELLNGTGIPSNWEGTVKDPSIVITNSTMMLWYSGYGFWVPPQPPAPNPAVGLAYCSLVLVPTTTFVTTTVTSVVTNTINIIKTVTSVSSTTQMVSSPELPFFEAVAGVFAVLLVISLAVLYRMTKRHG